MYPGNEEFQTLGNFDKSLTAGHAVEKTKQKENLEHPHYPINGILAINRKVNGSLGASYNSTKRCVQLNEEVRKFNKEVRTTQRRGAYNSTKKCVQLNKEVRSLLLVVVLSILTDTNLGKGQATYRKRFSKLSSCKNSPPLAQGHKNYKILTCTVNSRSTDPDVDYSFLMGRGCVKWGATVYRRYALEVGHC
ncbi:hypothetical protein Btru_031612 [Bulinus truncatus]|nr:hypothetical protein Btru_031612 [Bulinus truncatus]